MRQTGLSVVVVSMLCIACGVSSGDVGAADTQGSAGSAIDTAGFNALNLAAGSMVLYELQVRSANACRADTGSPAQQQACVAKVAPLIQYHAAGQTCSQAADLEQIRLGTFDDLLEDTADFRSGITVRYVNEKVGANTLWIMPPFPNNDTWNLPDACDNLGSPYAVRDYFHAAGTLSRACIADNNRYELSANPCWGNDGLEAVIAQAHARGMKVMLDVAFNHFGHNYLMYDYASFDPVRERVAANEDLNGLWNFPATEDADLLHPQILDTPAQLSTLSAAQATSLQALQAKCPTLQGDALVRSFNVWREDLRLRACAVRLRQHVPRGRRPGVLPGRRHVRPLDPPRRQLHQQLDGREVSLPPRRERGPPMGVRAHPRISVSRAELLDLAWHRRLPPRSHDRPRQRHGRERVEVHHHEGRLLRVAPRPAEPRLHGRGVQRADGDEQGRRRDDRGLRRRHVRPRRPDQRHHARRDGAREHEPLRWTRVRHDRARDPR